MAIDATTIYLTIMLGNLFTVLLTGAYALRHADRRINLYILGKGTEFLGFTVAIIRKGLPLLIPVCVGNSLLIAGVALETLAMLRIAGFDSPKLSKAFAVGAAIAIAVFDAAALLGANGSQRIALVSMITVAAILVPTIKFLAARTASALERTVGLVYLLVIAGLSARSLEALLSGGTIEFLSSTPMQGLAYLSLALNQVLGSVGFLLLAKEEADRELLKAATTDALTGLWNRRTFRELAEAAIAQCARKHESLAFAIMDLDHFKLVNDRHGHIAGDEILKLFARAASGSLRPYDILARFGGEEFALLLPGVRKEEARTAAERLRAAVESARLEDSMGGLSVTVSIGLACLDASEAKDLEAVFRKADEALYRAKSNGRNRIETTP